MTLCGIIGKRKPPFRQSSDPALNSRKPPSCFLRRTASRKLRQTVILTTQTLPDSQQDTQILGTQDTRRSPFGAGQNQPAAKMAPKVCPHGDGRVRGGYIVDRSGLPVDDWGQRPPAAARSPRPAPSRRPGSTKLQQQSHWTDGDDASMADAACSGGQGSLMVCRGRDF